MAKKKRLILSSACTLGLLVNSASGISVIAQDKKQEKTIQTSERTVIIESSGEGTNATFNIRVPGPQDTIFSLPAQGFAGAWVGDIQGSSASTFGFISSEMSFDGKVVKGLPLSAEAVTEFIQVLGDGNRIVRKTSTTIYRDSEGRTRREQVPFVVGTFAGNADQLRTVFIFDPVNNSSYALDSNSKTAHKMMSFGRAGVPGTITTSRVTTSSSQIKVAPGVLQGSAIRKVQPSYPSVAKAAGVDGSVQVQVTIGENGDVIDAQAISGHPLLRDPAVEAAKQWKFKTTELTGQPVKMQGLLTFNFVLQKGENSAVAAAPALKRTPFTANPLGNTHQESLGKQTIEGVEAEGTRTIQTIPAGAIGNERPIEIINERWYSQELQMVVMSKQSDPRIGETVYRLTNITRSEPDASLFQIPSDYKVQEGDNLRFMLGDKVGPIKRRPPNDQ